MNWAPGLIALQVCYITTITLAAICCNGCASLVDLRISWLFQCAHEDKYMLLYPWQVNMDHVLQLVARGLKEAGTVLSMLQTQLCSGQIQTRASVSILSFPSLSSVDVEYCGSQYTCRFHHCCERALSGTFTPWHKLNLHPLPKDCVHNNHVWQC